MKIQDDEWQASDQAEAVGQGWQIITVFDADTKKFFDDISCIFNKKRQRFKSGYAAQAFVVEQARSGDRLAIKAMRIMYRSRTSPKARTKKNAKR